VNRPKAGRIRPVGTGGHQLEAGVAETETDTGAAGQDGAAGADGVDVRTDAPYRAEAVCGEGDGGGERWHLTVRSLDDHPDRGEVDALVVTVTPRASGDGFPAADLDRTLGQCGFRRDGEWAADGARWTAPFHQPDSRAAPPAPPTP
jgi:hypothetical protein